MQNIHIRELDGLRVEKIRTKLERAARGGDKDVLFEISSRGGDHDAVFELIEFLSKNEFRTSCFVTRSASAAALLAISCADRKIRKKGKMFLHAVELTIPVTLVLETGVVPQGTLEKCRARQQQTEELLREKTKLANGELTRIMAPGSTGTFNSQEALHWGLVDEVLDY